MAGETALTAISVIGPYPASVGANALDFAFTAGDNVNGNKFTCTGREIIVVQNTDAAPGTFTITSTVDKYNRTQDITDYSVGAGEFAAFIPAIEGWADGSAQVVITPSAATIEFAILRY